MRKNILRTALEVCTLIHVVYPVYRGDEDRLYHILHTVYSLMV